MNCVPGFMGNHRLSTTVDCPNNAVEKPFSGPTSALVAVARGELDALGERVGLVDAGTLVLISGVDAEVVDVPTDSGVLSLPHALSAVAPSTAATARPILRSCIPLPPAEVRP